MKEGDGRDRKKEAVQMEDSYMVEMTTGRKKKGDFSENGQENANPVVLKSIIWHFNALKASFLYCKD